MPQFEAPVAIPLQRIARLDPCRRLERLLYGKLPGDQGRGRALPQLDENHVIYDSQRKTPPPFGSGVLIDLTSYFVRTLCFAGLAATYSPRA